MKRLIAISGFLALAVLLGATYPLLIKGPELGGAQWQYPVVPARAAARAVAVLAGHLRGRRAPPAPAARDRPGFCSRPGRVCACGCAICPACCAASGFALLVLALARPLNAVVPTSSEEEGIDLVMVLDLSGSMRAVIENFPEDLARLAPDREPGRARHAPGRRQGDDPRLRLAPQDGPHRRRGVRQGRLRAVAADARLPAARHARVAAAARSDRPEPHRHRRRAGRGHGAPAPQPGREQGRDPADGRRQQRGRGCRRSTRHTWPPWSARASTPSRSARATRPRCTTASTCSGSRATRRASSRSTPSCSRASPKTTGGESYVATDAQALCRPACTTCSISWRRPSSRRTSRPSRICTATCSCRACCLIALDALLRALLLRRFP